MNRSPAINIVCAFLFYAAFVCSVKVAAIEDNIVATKDIAVHTLLAEGDHAIAVKSEYETVYTAIRADDEVVATKLYGDYVEMVKASAPGVKPHYMSWEPDGMFHTGSKICAFQVPVKKGKEVKVTFATRNKWPEQFCGVALVWPYNVKEAMVKISIPAALAGRYSVEPRNLPQQMLLQKVVEKNGDVCYTLTASDITSRKAEDGAPTVAEDAPQLFITGHFNDLKALYNYFRSFEADETDNDDSVAEMARRLTASCRSEEEKVDSIAAWVRNNIRYVAVENGDYALRPASAGEVLSKRFGDCKGSANLIKAMMRDVGIDGRLVWVGTRGEVPTQWSEIPSLQSGNHQIACAVVNDSIIYVDGTSSYAPDGYLPWGIRGREALIENGDDYILREIPNTSRHPDKESLKGDFVIDGDNLRGALSRTYTGHNRAYIANLYYSSTADKRKDLLERLLTYPKKNLVAADAALRLNSLSDAECAVESVEAVDNGAARHTGNKCYIDLRPIRAFGFDIVDVESRERGLSAKPVSDYESEVRVMIPEGYSLEQLPENRAVENQWFCANLEYTATEDSVTARATLKPRSVPVPTEKLKEYNNAVKMLRRMSQAQIVLKYEK